MNYNKLIECQKAWENMDKLANFIDILQNPYCNTIEGFDYSNGKNGKKVYYDLDGELREMVISYLKNKLDQMGIEFEKM